MFAVLGGCGFQPLYRVGILATGGPRDALGAFTEKQCTPSLFYLSAFKENAYGVSLHLFCDDIVWQAKRYLWPL